MCRSNIDCEEKEKVEKMKCASWLILSEAIKKLSIGFSQIVCRVSMNDLGKNKI